MKVIGMSDSKGYILDENLDLDIVRADQGKGRGKALVPMLNGQDMGQYGTGSVYDVDVNAEIILPCGTQNEINLERAKRIIRNGALMIAEGANMPDDNEAVEYYLKETEVIFLPGKAANAGGVATSTLEMSQNSCRLPWTMDEANAKLQGIMTAIFRQCRKAMLDYELDPLNYVQAANIAGMPEKSLTP